MVVNILFYCLWLPRTTKSGKYTFNSIHIGLTCLISKRRINCFNISINILFHCLVTQITNTGFQREQVIRLSLCIIITQINIHIKLFPSCPRWRVSSTISRLTYIPLTCGVVFFHTESWCIFVNILFHRFAVQVTKQIRMPRDSRRQNIKLTLRSIRIGRISFHQIVI